MFREQLESILGYDERDPKRGGRPPFDAVLMLKILVLQKYYGLSDEETEVQIMDRFSFLQFLGLHPGDNVPDARTHQPYGILSSHWKKISATDPPAFSSVSASNS